MAHPIVSFQFADGPPLCFSIETRKEIGESYFAIGGLYRQYELIYVCADERDVIRVRTNYRHGEDIYLYRMLVPPAQARERFLEYVKTLNALNARPAGITQLRPIVPPAFVPSIPQTSACRGIGAFSLTAKATSCYASGTSSPPVVSPSPNSSSAAESTNALALRIRIRTSRALFGKASQDSSGGVITRQMWSISDA
jgi:hypothetical protein